jgi:hypothetical protein
MDGSLLCHALWTLGEFMSESFVLCYSFMKIVTLYNVEISTAVAQGLYSQHLYHQR